MSKEQMRALIDDDADWRDFFERPLGEVLEATFADDVVRGVVLTDALIGTFADAHDPSLRQNLCFLYHVIGNGTGDWDVPIGGMGALTGALAERARGLGVQIATGIEVEHIAADPDGVTVHCADGTMVTASMLLANCAPAELARLLGDAVPEITAEDAGAQIKVNMLLRRLPRLLDQSVDPREAFAGTFHINESYSQLQAAFAQARSGALPDPVPVEIYCHSLSDPSILGPELQSAGAQTLTAFALQTPHALFADGRISTEAALASVEQSLDRLLAEPIRDCLWTGPDGHPCIEAHTTLDLQSKLRIPTGNIFHTPLDWPFAVTSQEIGSWGVETAHPRIVLCGAGARRGGGVSGIPGHNAARHVLSSA
jgi:phytoene dehydrogenase-like protein